MQRYFGTAIGKGRQGAKTEVERLKLGEISCEQGVTEVAKMCALSLSCTSQICATPSSGYWEDTCSSLRVHMTMKFRIVGVHLCSC